MLVPGTDNAMLVPSTGIAMSLKSTERTTVNRKKWEPTVSAFTLEHQSRRNIAAMKSIGNSVFH